MENNTSNTDPSSFKLFLGFTWVLSLIIATFIGFAMGQGNKSTPTSTEKNVLMAATSQVTNTPVPTLQISPTGISNNAVCNKSGFSQNWEYLTAYVMKENDTLQDIVTTQLKDSTRVNEVVQLNGAGPFVVGTTLYLPPSTITKSSGNIKQVQGRLVEKNDVSWHLSFNGDIKGQGILIPSFWFEEIPNKDTYKVGDCLTILFDDGYKVYSVTQQKN